MSDEGRKVVQIAVTSATVGGGEHGDLDLDDRERLYALDSKGQIWMWMDETTGRTAGWAALDSPWDLKSEKKDKKKEK